MAKVERFNRVVAVGVDFQNDFCPGGSLAVEEGDQAVRTFNKVGRWVRQQSGIVIYTRDWHPAVTNHFSDTPNFHNTFPVHCVANTEGAAFHTDLDIRDGDPILSKGMRVNQDAFSGFQAISHNGLTLETALFPLKHERVAVVIGGLATEFCDEATVLDGVSYAERFKDYPRFIGVYAVTDAMRAVDPKNGVLALEAMEAAGARLITSQELLSGNVLQVVN